MNDFENLEKENKKLKREIVYGLIFVAISLIIVSYNYFVEP